MKTENVKFPGRLYGSNDLWLYDARTHEKVGEVYSGDLREELARRWNAHAELVDVVWLLLSQHQPDNGEDVKLHVRANKLLESLENPQ